MTDAPEDHPLDRSQRPRRGDGPPARSRRRGAAARRGEDDAIDGGPRGGATGVEADVATDHEKVARSVALRLLTSAPRSRAQLAEAMARKDVPADVAERVLDRFTDVGLIDDAEYAAILVRTRHTERGQARRAIAQELARRGVDPETAAEALGTIEREDEDAVAYDLVRRRAAASAGLPREKRERRLVAMLARKGHHPGGAFAIVRAVLDEEGAAGSHPGEERPEVPHEDW